MKRDHIGPLIFPLQHPWILPTHLLLSTLFLPFFFLSPSFTLTSYILYLAKSNESCLYTLVWSLPIEAWETNQWLHFQKGVSLSPSVAIDCQHHFSRRWGPTSSSPAHFIVLAISVSWGSYVGNHSCWGFRSAITMPCPEDSIPQHFSLSSASYILSKSSLTVFLGGALIKTSHWGREIQIQNV